MNKIFSKSNAEFEPIDESTEREAMNNIKHENVYYKDLSPLIQANINVACVAMQKDGLNLLYAPDVLKKDYDVVKLAVENNGMAIAAAHFSFRYDFEMSKLAVSVNGEAIEKLSDELKENKEIIEVALDQNGLALRFLSEKVKNSWEFVRIALLCNGNSLKYASDELKNNFEAVNLAVEEHGSALEFASENLRANDDIIRVATSSRFGYKNIVFASDDKVKSPYWLVKMFYKNPIFIDDLLNKRFKNDAIIIKDFLSELNQLPTDILLKSLHNIDTQNIALPSFSPSKPFNRSIEWITSRLTDEELKVPFEDKFLQQKIFEEQENRKILALKPLIKSAKKSRKVI